MEAVGIVVAFGATGVGVAVGRPVVGDGHFRHIVPEFAGWAVAEMGVGVGEEGRVGEWFLVALISGASSLGLV